MNWQLQDAKNRLSQLVEAATSKGPQVITIHGKETAVSMSIGDYHQRQPAQRAITTRGNDSTNACAT